MQIRPIQESDDSTLHSIIQASLEKHGLNIPGTAYFDPELAHLSRFYQAAENRGYFVVIVDGEVVGGAGFASFEGRKEYAELQKLYLAPKVQGQGISYKLIELVKQEAKKAGFNTLYLETHHNLEAATHIYEKAGFTRLDGQLPGSAHTTMDIFFQTAL